MLRLEGKTLSGLHNDSKGCGGVMRAAPVGLALWRDEEEAFQLGCELAAVTHTHPSGYLAAGALAAITAQLAQGQALPAAVDRTVELLGGWPGHEECSGAVTSAVSSAYQAPGSPETLAGLGAGWVAEEALAIGLYCALSSKTLGEGVILAANHSGDSDSTAAITGNLLGINHELPSSWREHVELSDLITQVAGDLFAHFGPGSEAFEPSAADFDRYPA